MSRTARLFICLIAFLTLFTLLWPGRVEASRLAACLATVTVTNANDSGAGSLRQALADVCSGGMVDFAAGLANQTITLTSAELSITKTVTITNPNAANLQVSGNNERRVFNIQAGAAVTMSGLSIISGKATEGGGDCPVSVRCGGGISNNGTLTINNSSIKSNITSNCGGGIYNSGLMTINDSILDGNSTEIEGGGICNSRVLTVNNTILTNNSALYGGGGIYNDAVLIVSSTILSGNQAMFGGGIDTYFGSVLTVTSSTFVNNGATRFGGGIVNAGTLLVNNSTFSNNSATDHGGGIDNEYAVLKVNNSTFSNNSAADGGGIFNLYGALNLGNSLVANSKGGDCHNNQGMIITNLNNLIEDSSCNPFLAGDPLLGPLQDNGGATLTHTLLPGSKAIDSGDNAACLSSDQRGFSRPQDGDNNGTAVCDIGAFEVTPTSTISTKVNLPLVVK
jgi:hypothetical protein